MRGWHALDGIYSKYFRGPFEYQFNIFCTGMTHKLLSRLLSWVFDPHSMHYAVTLYFDITFNILKYLQLLHSYLIDIRIFPEKRISVVYYVLNINHTPRH